MDPTATMTVTAGPDAGKSYALEQELVHIGRGGDNEFVINDDELAEHQASIARRNGRFAIYAAGAGAVRVDQNEIPAERWVWLPRAATIQFGGQTVCRLETAGDTAVSDATATPTSSPVSTTAAASSRASPKKSESERARRKGARKPDGRPHVARFLSDRTGEPLVKLGDDGQLPALDLTELASAAAAERRAKPASNPLVLYGALAFSFVMSLGMLLINPDGASESTSAQQASARQVLSEFYGDEGKPLKPYQQELRRALVKHAQGDYESERAAYRRVLRMLDAGDIRDAANLNGLTGRDTGKGRTGDDDLRQALETLLVE